MPDNESPYCKNSLPAFSRKARFLGPATREKRVILDIHPDDPLPPRSIRCPNCRTAYRPTPGWWDTLIAGQAMSRCPNTNCRRYLMIGPQ